MIRISLSERGCAGLSGVKAAVIQIIGNGTVTGNDTRTFKYAFREGSVHTSRVYTIRVPIDEGQASTKDTKDLRGDYW